MGLTSRGRVCAARESIEARITPKPRNEGEHESAQPEEKEQPKEEEQEEEDQRFITCRA
jgi:hypothetical protein